MLLQLLQQMKYPFCVMPTHVPLLSCKCREGPTTYGVTVNKVATIQDIITAAAPLAGLSAAEESLPVHTTVDVEMRRQPLSILAPNTQARLLQLLPGRHGIAYIYIYIYTAY